MDARALTIEETIEMATIEGARAIGREQDLGSLETGKQADIILIDLHKPHTTPLLDPLANLVYAGHGGDVDTVIVAGKILMQGRKVLVADEEKILTDAETAGHGLLKQTGLRVAPDWPIE